MMAWKLILILLTPLLAIAALHLSSWGRTFPRFIAHFAATTAWLLALILLLSKSPDSFSAWPSLGIASAPYQALLLCFFSFLFLLLVLLCPSNLYYVQKVTLIFLVHFALSLLLLSAHLLTFFVSLLLLILPFYLELRVRHATPRQTSFFLFFQSTKILLLVAAFASLYADLPLKDQPSLFSLHELYLLLPHTKISFLTSLLFALALFFQIGLAPLHLPSLLLFQKARYSALMAYLFSHALLGSTLFFGSLYLLHLLQPLREVLLIVFLLNAFYFSLISLTQNTLRSLALYQYLSFLSLGMTLFLTPNRSHLHHSTIELAMVTVVFGGVLGVLWLAEARLDVTRITQHQGLARRLPSLAAFFFLLVLTALGFPGTIGYIAEELVLQTRFNHDAVQGFASLVVIGLNAWVMFRCFSRVFLGPVAYLPHFDISLKPREYLAFLGFVLIIVINGFVPYVFFRFS
ncbi:hypothetical protein L6R29_00695 [Myxococcota bacterium]|nr:hypothetical protein [Myxococcota bacterium]